MGKQRSKLTFLSIKGKLHTFVLCASVREKIEREVLIAHEAMKLGLFFFKGFCLNRGRVPDVSHYTMMACLNQVTCKSNKGAKCKSNELGAEMRSYWDIIFSKIYPEKVNMTRRSRLKAIIADQMETLLLTNATTHFRSRCVKTGIMRGLSKSEAIRLVNAAFLGK